MAILLRHKKTVEFWVLLKSSADLNWHLIAKQQMIDSLECPIKSISLKKLEAEFEYVRDSSV